MKIKNHGVINPEDLTPAQRQHLKWRLVHRLGRRQLDAKRYTDLNVHRGYSLFDILIVPRRSTHSVKIHSRIVTGFQEQPESADGWANTRHRRPDGHSAVDIFYG